MHRAWHVSGAACVLMSGVSDEVCNDTDKPEKGTLQSCRLPLPPAEPAMSEK